MNSHSERFTFAPLCLKDGLVIRHIRCVGRCVAGALYLKAINNGLLGLLNGVKSTSHDDKKGDPSLKVGLFVISYQVELLMSTSVLPPGKSDETYIVRSFFWDPYTALDRKWNT